jgi:branched-chain amino acid transport system permease protein
VDIGNTLLLALGEFLTPTTAAYALAALGLAVHFGYSGLLNFGQAGFMAVGAYGFAISTLQFNVPFVVGFLIAVVCAALFALLLGVPTLRLRADYLAIVTIAAAEIVRYIVTTNTLFRITGSADGLSSFQREFDTFNPFPPGTYMFGWSSRDLYVRVVSWAVVTVCALIVWLLMRSPWGRVLKGIREDENAVRSLGKNV